MSEREREEKKKERWVVMQNPKKTHARMMQPKLRKSKGKEKRERERVERDRRKESARDRKREKRRSEIIRKKMGP